RRGGAGGWLRSPSPACGGDRAAPATPHVPISAASTPRWISASEPASRARTGRLPTSSPARGDTAARLRPG
ncbi:Os01g0725000, partial [Oryza sativa Japonica Group]